MVGWNGIVGVGNSGSRTVLNECFTENLYISCDKWKAFKMVLSKETQVLWKRFLEKKKKNSMFSLFLWWLETVDNCRIILN